MESPNFAPYLSPTADWLTVTVPKDIGSLVVDSVHDVVSSVPGVSAAPEGGWRFASGGCVRVSAKGAVTVISCSGAALVTLRALRLFGDYLRTLSAESHRVTRLDVALDVPVSAPPLLEALYRRACTQGVRLTHKPCSVRKYMAPNSAGVDTGTVYLGSPQAKVRARVYDKQQERLDKGHSDPGPWTRYELTGTADIGVSLKDAWEPAPFFWHYARGVIPAPMDAPPWVPGGVGFVLPPRPVLTPSEAFQRRLDGSLELRDIVSQSLRIPDGYWRLLVYLRKSGVKFPAAA